MKRLICLALAFVFLITTFGVLTPCIDSVKKSNDALSISTQINTLVKKYESRQDAQNRLIVNSSKLKNSYGAVAVIKARNFQILQFDSNAKAENAKKNIEKLKISCESDSFAYIEAVKKAPSSTDMWAINNVQSNVTNKFLLSTGDTYKDITVAVIDTGVNDKHELLKGRIVECNKNFSSTGKADSSEDDNGHGTNVSGIVALNTLDNIKIKPYKTFDKDGKCTNSQIISTLNYILNEKKLPDVINMSFSIQSIASSITRDSITRQLISKGVTIVTSAGNKGVNAKYYYPANIAEVITVSASNKKNEKADFSNFGKCVDIAAPGTGIYTSDIDGTYVYQNGTSFSAPFVSAAAATLLMQQKNNLNCQQVESELMEAAVPVYNETTQYDWCGAGIVNFSGLICGEKVDAPTFSVDQGKYNEPFELEINANDGDKIMFTTDNTIPTAKKGIEYTQPIEINDDTHIIAVAYENSKKSMYTSSTYEIVYDGDDNDFDVTDDGVIVSYNGDKTNITVPETIEGITIRAVGDNVFNDSTLKNITLPYTVKRIGVSAFANSNLATITAKGVVDIDNGAFENCESLVSVDMDSVKTVGNRCFRNCKKLTEVPFNEVVEEIGSSSFSFTALCAAEFPKVISAQCAFEGSKVVVANMPLVKNTYRTFTDCSLLSSVNMQSLENIGSFTFDNCTSLSDFSTGNIKTVDSYAFRGTPIINVDLKNCTSLGTQAFYDCGNLTTVSIPKVKVIEPNTFSYCYSLQNIDMKNVERFNGLDEKYFTDCISLKGLYLPKSVNLPNISWSSTMLGSIAFGTKPKLSFVFAPKAVDVASGSDAPFMSKCSRLEYAVLTSAKSLENIESVSSCVFYFGSNLGALPDCEDAEFKIVAPDDSYAVKWARIYDCDYAKTSSLKFSSLSSSKVVYEADGESYKLPLESVKALWSVEYINAKKSDNTIASLLDFNNDGVLNSKDYFYLNRI